MTTPVVRIGAWYVVEHDAYEEALRRIANMPRSDAAAPAVDAAREALTRPPRNRLREDRP